MNFNHEGFAKSVRQARRESKITILQATRLRFWARRHEQDALALACDCCDGNCPTTAAGLIDWDNFNPDKFDQFLKSLISFIEILLQLFGE